VTRRLPPLNALRAFEAAGRHVSFTKAAEELFVTPGAISRQIKLLEEVLGVELFERTSRDLRITDEASDYVTVLGGVFDQVDRATKRLMGAHRERSLRVHCAMTFTLRWLVPRLPLFHRLYPKREIQLATSLSPMPVNQLSMGDIDIAIQQGAGDWPGLVVHRLAGSALIPVCSPAFLERLGSPPSIEALAEQTLLHSMVRNNDWRDWLDAAGARHIDGATGLHFESSTLAYQSAIEGLGVAIGQMVLVIDDLMSGRLVAPFDLIHDNGVAYYLTYVEHAMKKPGLVEFRDWILAQSVEYEATLRNARLPDGRSLAPG
jgi:LysR family glycine cleavage system transcriptional activator